MGVVPVSLGLGREWWVEWYEQETVVGLVKHYTSQKLSNSPSWSQTKDILPKAGLEAVLLIMQQRPNHPITNGLLENKC